MMRPSCFAVVLVALLAATSVAPGTAWAAPTITSRPPEPTNNPMPTFGFDNPAIPPATDPPALECRVVPTGSDPESGWGACTAANSHTADLSSAPDGDYVFGVRIVGDDASVDSEPFTLDTTPPTVAIETGPTGMTSDQTPTFTFVSESEPAVDFECKPPGAADFTSCGTSGSFTTQPLANGTYTFSVRGVDQAGNKHPSGTSQNFTVEGPEPVARITSGPPTPTTDSTPTFTFTASGSELPVTFQCRVDGAQFGPCSDAGAHTTPPLAVGAHVFEVRASDANGVGPTDARGLVIVAPTPPAEPLAPLAPSSPPPPPPVNAAPLARIAAVGAVRTLDRVTLRAESVDPDGSIASNRWDLDNDGEFDDGAGAVVTTVFRRPGRHVVRLQATDAAGASAEATQAVAVGNRSPRASFVVLPTRPSAGTRLTFTSTSSDPDGPAPSVRWDLDGDGAFDDGARASVRRTFNTAGRHTVRLLALDADGGRAITRRVVTVSRASFLAPFPIVRIAGSVSGRGARIRLLSVLAPRRARIEVRCAGRSCPTARQVAMSRGRRVTFPRLARRLRAGVVLEIRVTRPGAIGKYTRFRIVRNRAPQRSDACLVPGTSRPRSCPAG